jgi:hypothetical protein
MRTRISKGQRFECDFADIGKRQAEVVEVSADRRKGRLQFLDDGSFIEMLAVRLNGRWRAL